VVRKKGEKMPLSNGKFYICKDNDHFLEYKYLYPMSELNSNSGNKMATGNETGIEISYMKRFNLGNYQHKEYSVKLNGTEAQIEQQFNERKERLKGYLEQMEGIVDLAHEANILKARAERENLLKQAADEERRALLEATSDKKLDKVS
jgi:putative cell wall-binding protein